MEAAAGEKLRLVANFPFFFHGDISTDFHRDSTNSLPAHIDAPPPMSWLVFAARKIGRTVANVRLYSFTGFISQKLCFHELLNSGQNEPKINTRPFAILAYREFFFFSFF